MIPTGCTCKHKFTIPFSQDEIEAIRVTYCQNGMCVLEKELGDCSFEDDCVCVDLSQEEALLFNDRFVVRIQLKVRLENGAVTKSRVIVVYADEVLNKEVI